MFNNVENMIRTLNAMLIQLTEEPGRTVTGIAENLGISKDLLYRWRGSQRVNKELAFPGNGREALTSQQQKLGSLRKG